MKVELHRGMSKSGRYEFRHLRLTKVAVTKAGGDALPRNGDRLKYFSFDLEHPMDAVISVTRKKIAKCLILL